VYGYGRVPVQVSTVHASFSWIGYRRIASGVVVSNDILSCSSK